MKNKRKTVVLLYGGQGKEHDVSQSGSEYVKNLVDKDKYRLLIVYIDRGGRFWLECEERQKPTFPVRIKDKCGFLIDGRITAVDAVLPLLHGDFGEDGRIQGALDVAGIKYVGCGVSAGSLICDKVYTKRIAAGLGIPVVDFVPKRGAKANETDFLALKAEAEQKLGYPMFIKPIALGSSVGASLIEDATVFERAYRECLEASPDVMVERYIGAKRELECAYLSVLGKEYLSGAGEIRCDGVYTYSEKYSKTSMANALAYAALTEEIAETVKGYSLSLVRELGVRHLCRIDYFLSGNTVYLNEINTMPGFTEASLYPKLVETLGISPSELVNSLIEDAVSC